MNKYSELLKRAEDILVSGKIFLNEPMNKHTSFKIGGNADVLIQPGNKKELIQIVLFCKNHNLNHLIMGKGSNILVSDNGVKGIIIKTSDCLNNYSINGEIIECEAGILLSKLSVIACENNLSGLEFASGIPGTLGGAIVMNAGAYGQEMKDIVIETELIDNNGNVKTIDLKEHGFGYRKSNFQKNNWIVISSKLKLKKGIKEDIKKRINELNNKRKAKQPLEFPSAGSIFKRPEGYYAGKLIEDSGLRGYTIGGAQVSEKHCGFIVNKGDATAEDVIQLIEYIKKTVLKKYNVELQTEIKVVGNT